jgi:transcriptional regulator with XRE-family HTH domain
MIETWFTLEPTEESMHVLTKLKSVRESKGVDMTPERLAILAGISNNTVRRAEKGRGITLNNAKALAKALKTTIKNLEV